MSDVLVTDVTVEETPQDIIRDVALKQGLVIEGFNFSTLPNETYIHLLEIGLKTVAEQANGAAKAFAGITKLEGKALEDRKAEIQKAVDKTVEQLKANQIPGAKKAKASGAVNTEAMRLAKIVVKEWIKSKNMRIGAFGAKELTAAAKKVLESNPQLLVQAQKNLDSRAAEVKGTKEIGLEALFGAKVNSDEVKAKPKALPKKKEKGTISAKQAAMVAPKAKPGTHLQH